MWIYIPERNRKKKASKSMIGQFINSSSFHKWLISKAVVCLSASVRLNFPIRQCNTPQGSIGTDWKWTDRFGHKTAWLLIRARRHRHLQSPLRLYSIYERLWNAKWKLAKELLPKQMTRVLHLAHTGTVSDSHRACYQQSLSFFLSLFCSSKTPAPHDSNLSCDPVCEEMGTHSF